MCALRPRKAELGDRCAPRHCRKLALKPAQVHSPENLQADPPREAQQAEASAEAKGRSKREPNPTHPLRGRSAAKRAL